MFGLRTPEGVRVKGCSVWAEVKVANASGSNLVLPKATELGFLASALVSNKEAVSALQTELPLVLASLAKGDGLASALTAAAGRHECLRSHPLLCALGPHLPLMEAHLVGQAKSMYALLRQQSALLQKQAKQQKREEVKSAKDYAKIAKQKEKIAKKAAKIAKKALKEAKKASKSAGKILASPAEGKQEEPVLRSKFVCDVTIQDNECVAAGVKLNKVWKMVNSGSTAWPEGTVIRKVTSTNGFECPDVMELSQLPAPGKECAITLPLTVPTAPGKYVGTYRLAAPEAGFFGRKIWVAFVVKSDSAPVKQESGRYAAELESLFDLGYADNDLNMYLLGVYDGSVQRSVKWLVANK